MLLGANLAGGCGAPVDQPSDIGSFEQPIVNGNFDNGDPAVVALTAGGQAFCSATLIRPTVVLTAAHCLPPNLGDFGITSYQQIDVFFGSQVGSGELVDVVDGWTNPGWNDNVFENDVGLVRLAEPGPATPIDFATDSMTSLDQGAAVRLVGFGITQSGGSNSGVKRQGNTTIAQVFDFVFTMGLSPSGTCNGDSGGPTLMMRNGQEVVAGIHSRSDCASEAIDTRVDDYQQQINAFIGESPGPQCFADGECASECGAPDPDCPCADDSFCTDACTAPETDPDCLTSCGVDGVCNPACTVMNPDPDCTPGQPNPGSCASGECDWAAGDLDDQDIDGELVTSCAAARGQTSPAPWLWLASLLVLARPRRRR